MKCMMCIEVYLWHADKHRKFLQVDTIILAVLSQVCPKYPKQVCIYLCNISRRTQGMKMIFCLQINTKVFYKLLVLLWVSIARHAQSIQNNKITISLQYLQENVMYEVDFLSSYKYQRFLQIDTIILEVCVARHAQITQKVQCL